jgi:hypothetical protein
MTHHACECCDEEYTLPSVEALMAGTLALLTGYAQSPTGGAHRPAMAAKVVANLRQLSEHPELSTPMRTMLANLRTRWQVELEQQSVVAQPLAPTALWHPAPAGVQ